MAKTIDKNSTIKKIGNIKINTDYIQTVNVTKKDVRSVSYIVMHYTSNTKDKAINNAKYFLKYRGASAHYFVDESEIYQSVALNNIAWHCGTTGKYYSDCRNTTSIGIEMCCSGNSIVSQTTINNATKLCIELCKTIGITDKDVDKYVLRHYDVTHKNCPAQWVKNEKDFTTFKEEVKKGLKPIVTKDYTWADKALNVLVQRCGISKDVWKNYEETINKADFAALIDKATGGTRKTERANANIHWCQPVIMSLVDKGIIDTEEAWLVDLNAKVNKAMVMGLIDKATGGTVSKYIGRKVDHYGRNFLDSLQEKGIISTPSAWIDFENGTQRGIVMALISNALDKMNHMK